MFPSFKFIAICSALFIVSFSIVSAASLPSILDCNSGSYICKRNAVIEKKTCLKLNQLCDGKKDCPFGDDEENDLCGTIKKLREQSNKNNNNNKNTDGTENDFSGTGFMFSIDNLIIDGGSDVKMFNQNSDNNVPADENMTENKSTN